MRWNAMPIRAWAIVLSCLVVILLTRVTLADLPVFTTEKAVQAKANVTPTLVSLDIGWDGKYRVGNPVEIRARLSAQEYFQGVVYLLVQDADGNEVRYGPIHNFSYKGDSSQKYRQIITAPRAPFQVTIELRILPLGEGDTQQLIYQKKDFTTYPVDISWARSGIAADAIASTREAWLELGPSLNLRNIAALNARDANQQPVIVSLPKYYQLPMDYSGFAGIVFVSSIVPGQSHDVSPGSDKYNVTQWVRQGGQLLVVLHENGAEVPRGADFAAYWRDLLPGRLTSGRVPHQQFSAWEQFLGTEEPLVINEELRRKPPLIPVFSDLQGTVLLRDGDTPLVIEHQLGLGRVVTCLVDLNAEPWRNWKKRDELLQRLIPWHIPTEAEAKFASSSSSLRLGYDDLSGQFVMALGTFQGVSMKPFWILMSAALGFAVVWYFLQTTLLKAWSATARLVVAAFVVAAAMVGFTLLTGGFTSEPRLLANTAQVVDYNAMQGEYRGQCWMSLLSSNSRQVDLQADVGKLAAPGSDQAKKLTQQLEWLGMPGKGWGGLDAPLATWTQASEPYQLDSYGATANDLTLSPDLTKSFHERWHLRTPAKQTTPLVSYHGESLPRGTLKSELPFALRDAILLYDTWGVELGTIQPGQVIDLEQVRGRVAAAGTIITGKRAQSTTPGQSYDRANTDVPQILKLMLLHRAAGGTRYTGLFSRAWPLLDQSDSLTETQALILGTGPTPVKWNVGPTGEKPQPLEPTSDVCWYRLWLPVVPNEQANESINDPTVIRLPEKME